MLNNCEFIGHIGQDPKYINDNKQVAIATLAVNEKIKDEQVTLWIDLVFFGKQAELAMAYLPKKTRVYVQGKIALREWEARDGTRGVKLQLKVSHFINLERKEARAQLQGSTQESVIPYDDQNALDDDLPF